MKLPQKIWLAAALAGVAAVSASAAPAASVPNFSGIWTHQWDPGFEALDSGPTALINLARLPDGKSNVAQLAGDYHNPILKPEAAETVRKLGEELKEHFGFHNPRNQCWPMGLPFVLSSDGLEIFDRGDHLLDHLPAGSSAAHRAHECPAPGETCAGLLRRFRRSL